MRTGAVALIDALGFRGIWRRYDPDAVLTELKAAKNQIEQQVERHAQTYMDPQVAFLSDTIAISTLVRETKNHRLAWAVLYLVNVIADVLDLRLRSNVPLAYRGAIAVGNYEVSSHFLIGEAIDEAANARDLAQGAFIWITPEARNEVAQLLKDKPECTTGLVEFEVPLKSGDTFSTFTVSPIARVRSENDAHVLTQRLLGTFSSRRMDVAIKRQNTIRHMRACYAARKFSIPAELSTL
jgi:hypothetical protein